MAVIVPADIDSPPSEEDMVAYCRKHLASFKCPAIIHFVDELPRTTTGKILKGHFVTNLCLKPINSKKRNR